MTLILGVTGSIAAYKAADLTSQLTKLGYSVHCIMTESATEFIPPLTLQTLSRNPVLCSLEDEKQSWQPGHIALADRADLMVIAPATANTLGLLANGLTPDSLTSTYLALPKSVPTIIAPAMNGKMWTHPSTQRNVSLLKQDGVHFIEPESGDLACGYQGVGRLAELPQIISTIQQLSPSS